MNLGYYAVFDALGYKSLAARKTLAELVAWHSDLRLLAGDLGTDARVLPTNVIHDARPLRWTMFSDTIIAYGRPGLVQFQGLVWTAARLLAAAMERGIALRGAIVKDELHVSDDGAIMVGKACIRAHELEAAQDAAGVVVSLRNLDAREQTYVAPLVRWGILREIDVPWKKDKAPHDDRPLVLAWPTLLGISQEQVRVSMTPPGDVPLDVQKKIDNTANLVKRLAGTDPIPAAVDLARTGRLADSLNLRINTASPGAPVGFIAMCAGHHICIKAQPNGESVVVPAEEAGGAPSFQLPKLM